MTPRKVSAQNVDFAPPGYSNPFGSYGYNGNQFVSTLSPEEKASYGLNQQKLQDVTGSVPSNGAQQNDFTKKWQDTYYNKMLQQALPSYIGSQYSRGVGAGSSGFQSGLGDLYLNASQNSILGAQDLANQQFQQMLQAGNYFGGNLKDIYNRMSGIAGLGLQGGQQYLNNAQMNAGRAFDASKTNTQAMNDYNRMLMQDLSGSAGGGGYYGGGGGNYGGVPGTTQMDPQIMQAILMQYLMQNGGLNMAAAVAA